ncbi:hypothetical protein JCM13591A_01420 [Microbacterium xylanilyticum]
MVGVDLVLTYECETCGYLPRKQAHMVQPLMVQSADDGLIVLREASVYGGTLDALRGGRGRRGNGDRAHGWGAEGGALAGDVEALDRRRVRVPTLGRTESRRYRASKAIARFPPVVLWRAGSRALGEP